MVKVPVLSEQMLFAPPMVSQASMRLTKFWSFNIFLTEKAKERVTERGSPSGMATTTTMMPMMKKSRIETRSVPVSHFFEIPFSMANLTMRTAMMVKAEYRPNFPISVASYSSFC